MEVIAFLLVAVFLIAFLTIPFKIAHIADVLDSIYERIDNCIDSENQKLKKGRSGNDS